MKTHDWCTVNAKHANYCTVLISTLFDIEKDILVNYALLKHKSERKGLLNQLKYLRKNDTLVMDRGYFSYNLLYTLNENKINVVFRLKYNLIILSNLKNQTTV